MPACKHQQPHREAIAVAHHVPARSMLYSNNRVMLQNSPLLVTDVEFSKQMVGNLGTTELEVTLR